MSVRSSCFCRWYDQSHRYCPCSVCRWYDQSHRYCPCSVCRWYDQSHRYCPGSVCRWYDQSHRYCPGSVCRWYDQSHRYCPCRAKLMKQMSPKACVLDPVSTSLVFGCSDEIVPLLTAIVNQLLTTGLFPSCVKAAAVKPLWRKQLSFKATKTHVFSFILSKFGYCNAGLGGPPQVLFDKIHSHSPALYDLHWLPISSRIQYKKALVCFHIVSGTAPPYISELLHLCSSSCSLRSTSDTWIIRVPRMGRRARWRDPFSTSDLLSGTLFLSLLGILLHSLLLSQHWKPTSSLLHIDLSLSFLFPFYQPVTSIYL